MEGKRVSSEDCVRIFNASQINLNLHSSTFHEGVNPHGDFVNPRTFEIAACGGFQLVDQRELLNEMFDLETELVTFRSIDELKEQIDYFLNHPDEAAEKSEKSRIRVLAQHTFQHRMQEMLIHVFSQNLEGLERRIRKSNGLEDYLIRESADDSELQNTLEQYKDETDLSIQSIAAEIKKGEGELSPNELLLLMVEQVVK
jgi:spore maturation protein CgeB